MKRRPVPPPTLVAARDGELVVVVARDPFTFEAGHRMRAAHCAFCHALIGGQPATVVGVGALGGDACDCGAITSDLFLLHACHLPLSPAEMQAMIWQGLKHDHPWQGLPPPPCVTPPAA